MKPEARAVDDAQLVSDVQRAFPAFAVSAWEPLGEGWMSRALLLNGNRVARFAKSASASADLEKESFVLPRVAERVSLAVPRFELFGQQSNGLRFVVYPLLPGEPLEETLGVQPPRLGERLAEQLAGFIDELQSLPVAQLAAAGLESTDLHADLTADAEAWRQREPELPRDVFRYVQQRFDEYLAEPAFRSAERRFLHADLSPNHWLFDAQRGELSGIIDFGDCELGDPDYEYVCLLEDAGEAFTRRVLELQGKPDVDARLRKLRYLVTFDHAHGVLTSERYEKPEWREECLAALRAELRP